MPWYEPAVRAPPTPHRLRRGDGGDGGGGPERNDGGRDRCRDWRDDEEAVDVRDYLTDDWDYSSSFPPGDRGGQQQRHRGGFCAFDGFQRRVESHLGGVFPLAGFPSSHDHALGNLQSCQSSSVGASLTFGSDSLIERNDERHAQNQNDHPNLKKEGGGNKAAVSKAAQFFHPRPVMALMPYRNFFSPLQFPAVGEGAEEQKPSLENDEIGGNEGNDSRLPWQAAFPSQPPHQDNARHQQLQTPAEHYARDPARGPGPGQEAVVDRPMSILKPMTLFGDVASSSKNIFKRPPKQTTLVQDSTTGQMVAESNSSQASRLGGKKKAKAWDDYGGRPLGEEERKEKTKEREKTKEKRKDKEKKGKVKKQPTQSEGGMDAFLNTGKKRPSADSQEDDRAKAGKRKSDASKQKKQSGAPRSKKQKRDRSIPSSGGTELEIPSYDIAEVAEPEANAPPALSVEDFRDIEQTQLQNAAQCTEGLQQFLSLVGSRKYVAFTMLSIDPYTGNYATSPPGGDDDDADGGRKKKKKKKPPPHSDKYALRNDRRGFECTTAFLPSSKKYCTPKGSRCTAWNCTCDGQVRATRQAAALLGALFVFRGDADVGGGGGDGEWQCFLLPLGPTEDQEVEYPRMAGWPVIPFDCGVGLADRWGAFEAVLNNRSTKLVTYNATVSLLPFYHHLAKDGEASRTQTGLSSGQFSACLAGASLESMGQSNLPVCKNDGYLHSIWDLRLVSWMLRPHASDEELEFKTFQEGFPHLAPDHQQAPSSDMTIIMQGVVGAKNNLEFIYNLYPIMNKQLVDGGLLDALECIESPVQSILASMEGRGIGIVPKRLKSHEIERRLEELEAESRSITKDPDFLLSSPQQVSAFLFDDLKLTIPAGLIPKTKAGSTHRSTSEEALRAIKADMTSRTGSSPQILDLILDFRNLNKLLTTFIRPLRKVCTGRRSKKAVSRIYPQWMQTTVRTGRLSCRKPNLQQIPKSGACGVDPRVAFVAEQGMCLFACDYSQKEVRILAHMSGDDALISLFRGNPNIDIYKQMSSLIRKKPIGDVTDTDRAQFKQVTLAILYGMSPNQVAKKLSITKSSAQQMMNDFFRRFQRLKVWMDETRDYARRKSYVKTIAGRKRYLDHIHSDDNAKKSQAERQAINTVIQGSAADLMKTAMINLVRNLNDWRGEADQNGTSTRPEMLLAIHDELILEVRLKTYEIKQLKHIAHKSCCKDCEELFGLRVPLLLTCSAGMSWGAMKEI